MLILFSIKKICLSHHLDQLVKHLYLVPAKNSRDVGHFLDQSDLRSAGDNPFQDVRCFIVHYLIYPTASTSRNVHFIRDTDDKHFSGPGPLPEPARFCVAGADTLQEVRCFVIYRFSHHLDKPE